VTGYNVTYDTNAHTATGTATGIGGLNLSSGLNLTGTTHTDAGDYPNDPWTFTSPNANYKNDSGTVHDHIEQANATIVVTPYSVIYDTNPHTATGTATGIGGLNLSSGLNLTGTTHTNPGDYPSDSWTFTSPNPNYKNDSGTVHDIISFGPCSSGQSGILPPINKDGSSVYNRKGGSTIPVKFNVCGANGLPIANKTLVFGPNLGNTEVTMLSAMRGTITVVNEDPAAGIPDSAFSWDGSQWHFNMATTLLQAGNTYKFRINLAIGYIDFQVGVK
jgi:hypothetical protein